MGSYKLAWDEFCSWYLEMIKPEYQKPIDPITIKQAIGHFENILRILHPFMPFVTEEIWHLLKEREENSFIMMDVWPEIQESTFDLEAFDHMKEVVSQIRVIRTKRNIPNKTEIDLQIIEGSKHNGQFDPTIKKLCNLGEVEYVDQKPEGAISFLVNVNEYYIPLEENVDVEAEKKKLEEEINYLKGFLNAVDKKLSNKKFVDNAPDKVVGIEKKKKADAEAKLQLLQDQIASFNN